MRPRCFLALAGLGVRMGFFGQRSSTCRSIRALEIWWRKAANRVITLKRGGTDTPAITLRQTRAEERGAPG